MVHVSFNNQNDQKRTNSVKVVDFQSMLDETLIKSTKDFMRYCVSFDFI